MKVIGLYYRVKRKYYKGQVFETWKKVNNLNTDYLIQIMKSS